MAPCAHTLLFQNDSVMACEDDMKSIELHIHLPFSYWLDRDPETGARLQRPTERTLSEVLRCLAAEMNSMREDYDDCVITAIRFFGGYLSLPDAEDLKGLLAAAHRAFHVQSGCPICGTMFPGHLDMEKIALYRDRHVSPLMFEVPSLSFRECERLGFPIVFQALDKTVYFLQNYQEGEWGLRLPIGIAGRTEESWHYVLGQIYHYHPKYLKFFRIDPDLTEDPAFYAICADLQEHGYRRESDTLYAVSDTVPLLLRAPDAAVEYAGVGPGAESRIDGYLAKSTADWDAYRKNASSYRRLITTVKEIPETQQ